VRSLGERTVVAAGIPTRCREAGDSSTRPPLLLLHGFGDSCLVWEGTQRALAPRWRTIAPDLPGFGETPAPRDLSLATGLRWLAAFTSTVGPNRPLLVGHSMGGLLALQMALDRPQDVRGLVLVAPAAIGRELALSLRLLSLPLVGPWLARPSLKGVWATYRSLVSDPACLPAGLVEATYGYLARPGAMAAMLRLLRSGVNLRGMRPNIVLAGRLAEVQIRTLVVWGRQDPLIPSAYALAAAQGIAGAKLLLLGNCGHLPMIEHPPEFVAALERFAASVAGLPGAEDA